MCLCRFRTYIFVLIIFSTETAFSFIQYAPLLELKRARVDDDVIDVY